MINLSIVFNVFVSERLQLALYPVVVPSAVYEDDARLFGYILEILRCLQIMVFKIMLLACFKFSIIIKVCQYPC